MRRIAVLALLLTALPRPARADLATGDDVTTGAETEAGATDGADTGETMPPVYEPCGCRSAGEGAWGLLGLLALRRRRR